VVLNDEQENWIYREAWRLLFIFISASELSVAMSLVVCLCLPTLNY